jgi:hypothetical protein
VPADLDIHLVLDNYATHKAPPVKAWLARHPRYRLHFTPTSASWLNQVERWFALLADKQIKRRVHRSLDQLKAEIAAFIQAHNDHSKPLPPVTIERPRGPVRSSRRVRRLVASIIIRSTVVRVTLRNLRRPRSGRRWRSIRLRSLSNVDRFLPEHPSARYSSNNAFIVGSSFASSRVRAGSIPAAIRPRRRPASRRAVSTVQPLPCVPIVRKRRRPSILVLAHRRGRVAGGGRQSPAYRYSRPSRRV